MGKQKQPSLIDLNSFTSFTQDELNRILRSLVTHAEEFKQYQSAFIKISQSAPSLSPSFTVQANYLEAAKEEMKHGQTNCVHRILSIIADIQKHSTSGIVSVPPPQ